LVISESKSMKKIILLLAVLLCGLNSFAQNPRDSIKPATRQVAPESGNGKITGTVIDSTDKAMVGFATVALIDVQTNKPVDGTMTDEKGAFSLSKIREGNYVLTISFFGYENYTTPAFSISDKKQTLEIGTLTLSPMVKKMETLVIEGQRSMIEEKVDRTVYNAENDATNKGGDATDVLKKVPMLSVDLDGNVSMRGSQNVKVLINNKPSTITAGSIADALKQIPADQIKSVEVITSPSAKYDAEGSAGIINIILKKNNLQGFSLGIDGSAGIRGSSLGLNGSYRKGKMGFSLGGNGRGAYNIPGSFENYQQTNSLTGIQTVNTQKADTRNQRLFGNYSLGWDYDINKYNSLAAGAKYSLRNSNQYQDNLLTQSFLNDSLSNSSLRNVNVSDLSNTIDLSLNYTHTFKKPQREFSLLGLYSRNSRTNDFTNNIMDTIDQSTVASRLKNQNKSYNQEITVQADYVTPIGKTQILEIGAKNILRSVTSNYKYFYATGADGPYYESQNSQQNNSLDYHQNVTAGYLSYTLSFLKTYTVKAGARYEYTSISANLKDQTSISIPSYGVLVPSINVSKKFNNGNILKASYNRRIQRPSIQFLNPNIQASNPLNVTIGNPYLRPEYTNNYELAYSMYIKSSSISIAGFMRNTNNAIQSVRDILGTDTIRTTYQNIGNEDAYGFNIFTGINISSKFTLNGGADIYYAVLKNNVPNPIYNASNQGWVAGYRMSGTYNFTKTFGLQLFGFYRGRQVQLQGHQGGFGIYSLSVKKDFAEKRGSIGFGAENFFTPSFHIRNELQSPVINQHSTTILHTMNFKINFSYRIGKLTGDEKKKRRRSVNNDDLKDEGDNTSPPQNNPSNGGGGRPIQK
jgi:outer membrane receptor protein involved in Fe transport